MRFIQHSASFFRKLWEISTSGALCTSFLNLQKTQNTTLYFLKLIKFLAVYLWTISYKPILSVFSLFSLFPILSLINYLVEIFPLIWVENMLDHFHK